MIPIGTLFNIISVIIGSIIGLLLKRMIHVTVNKNIFFIIGLFTLVLGVSMAIETKNFILMLISLVFGTMLGEHYNLDALITKYTELIKKKLNIKDNQFTDVLMTALLLYCVGSMTIVGAIDEGLGKTPHILYTKSIMDGISSIEEIGTNIFNELIEVASGKKKKSEINEYGDDEFNPWVIGATM